MAGALMMAFSSGWEGIGYYFTNWNTDAFSIGCLLTLVLIISGYFYGCVFRNLIAPLKNTDCTLIGICFILALFQAVIFFMIPSDASTNIAYYEIAGILLISPLLCLFTWSSILPSWRHLASLVVGIAITAVLVYGSMNLNTNNIYFDSITYLSEVVESSKAEIFAHMVYPGGYLLRNVDPLHDYTGYYYFWGILIRWAVDLLKFDGLTTPIYIWGATTLYGMMLGMLAVSSACVLFKKRAWLGLLVTVAFMAPFYTNYFNTTLAFFGNTIRTVILGTMVLIAYLILRYRKSVSLFFALTVTYYAGLNVSSSSLFLIALVTTGLFFSMAFSKETDWKRWAGFIFSLSPLVHMAMVIVLNMKAGYLVMLGGTVVVILLLIGLAFLLRNVYPAVNKLFGALFPIALIGLLALSFMMRNSDYGYAYFFRSSSVDDMTVNMTSHVSTEELIRNIIFYGLLALTLLHIKVQTKFKVFLIVIILLFINPLVEPAVANLLTAGVYSRVFDILINPFTLCFLLFSLDQLIPMKVAGFALMAMIGAYFTKLGYDTLTVSYSKTLAVGTDEKWNWEAKVNDDSYELYEYIDNALATQDFDIKNREYDNRVTILSQDSGLKGYVSGIEMAFTTEDYRSALAGKSSNKLADRMVSLMYPDRRYTEDDMGDVGDYSKLGELFLDSEADYIVINNTLALWDERGWYANPYEELINNGMCTKIFENDSWAVLQMNESYKPAGKHTDRYWVHKYEE